MPSFEIRSKITALLRTRRYYSVPKLVNQFKIHIWDQVELNIGDYFHVVRSLWEKKIKIITRKTDSYVRLAYSQSLFF